MQWPVEHKLLENYLNSEVFKGYIIPTFYLNPTHFSRLLAIFWILPSTQATVSPQVQVQLRKCGLWWIFSKTSSSKHICHLPDSERGNRGVDCTWRWWWWWGGGGEHWCLFWWRNFGHHIWTFLLDNLFSWINDFEYFSSGLVDSIVVSYPSRWSRWISSSFI